MFFIWVNKFMLASLIHNYEVYFLHIIFSVCFYNVLFRYWSKLHIVYVFFSYLLGFPCSSAGKESACSVGDLDSIPGLGRSSGEGKPTHSSFLTWRIPLVHNKSDTTERLSLSIFISQNYFVWGFTSPLFTILMSYLLILAWSLSYLFY